MAESPSSRRPHSRSSEHDAQIQKRRSSVAFSPLADEAGVGDGQVQLLPPRLPEETRLDFGGRGVRLEIHALVAREWLLSL